MFPNNISRPDLSQYYIEGGVLSNLWQHYIGQGVFNCSWLLVTQIYYNITWIWGVFRDPKVLPDIWTAHYITMYPVALWVPVKKAGLDGLDTPSTVMNKRAPALPSNPAFVPLSGAQKWPGFSCNFISKSALPNWGIFLTFFFSEYFSDQNNKGSAHVASRRFAFSHDTSPSVLLRHVTKRNISNLIICVLQNASQLTSCLSKNYWRWVVGKMESCVERAPFLGSWVALY